MKRPSPERLVLGVGLLAAFLLCLGPVANPDLPWHLAVARRIVAERAVPRADFLSWTMGGQPWVDFEWLTQLGYLALHGAGGWAALWASKVVAFSLLGALLAALLSLYGLSGYWVGAAVPALMAALNVFIQVRPENASLLLFLAQLLALEARRLGRLRLSPAAGLAAHAAAYALWANLHAGFPMGLLLCACFAAGELLGGTRPSAASPLAWAAAGAAGTCLNPYGPGVYRVLWEHWSDMSALRALITEWAAPRLGNLYLSGYWLLLLFSLGGFLACVARREPLPAEHVVAGVAFALWASRSMRTTAYLTLLLFPLGLRAWSRVEPPAWWRRARPGALAALAAASLWYCGTMMSRDGWLRSIKTPSNYEPESAVAFLRAEKATLGGLKLYNPYNWGGYLDDVLYPDYRVFMDGRYLFAPLLKEVDQAERSPVRWTKLMEKHDVEVVLTMNTGLILSLRGATAWRPFDVYALPPSRWALVYWDRMAMVFVRRDKVPAQWLADREFRLIRPHDLRNLGLRALSGWVKLSDVQAEMDRYERDIGDPFEAAVMRRWLREFRAGLEAGTPLKAARTRPLPAPRTPSATRP